MRSFLQFALVVTALVTAPALAQESPIPKSPIAKTELVLAAGALGPDKPAYAGVHFSLPEGWHIYWQNPGDSGIPTTLDWTLPQGLTAGDLQWPVPERIEVSGIVNYGYSHDVTLAVPLLAAPGAAGGPVTVKATYLICRDVCIPETATLTGNLPASSAGAQTLIAEAQASTPRILKDPEGGLRENNLHATYSPTRQPNGTDTLELTFQIFQPPGKITSAQWFPIADGLIQNAGAQTFSTFTERNTDYAGIRLEVSRGATPLPKKYPGVLVYSTTKGTVAVQVVAEPNAAIPVEDLAQDPTASPTDAPAPAPIANVPESTSPAATHSLLALLGLAFLGGLILNVMPCVLPILALKALAIAKKAQASRAAAAKQGGAYTAGVVLSFLAIAGVMLTLKASGAAIGWGFQLQNTSFVLALGLVMLAVAANLLGLFELPVLFGEKATNIDDSSLRGSFLTGALAVLVATPCSAPFMATAIGATLALAVPSALAVFASLGLGMASPFLLISLWPAARRILPKPGAWMHRFKQLLAIPMLATAVWLFWVAASMHGMDSGAMPAARESYSAERLQQLRDTGTPVLLDATAAWCLTCKVNERVALHPESMQQFFRDHHVVLMVADWTSADPAITALLASFGRNGVPLYVYYPPHAEPKVLPQLLTPSIVRDTIATPDAPH